MANQKILEADPQHTDGLTLGKTAAKKVGFHGAAVIQRAGAAQAALGALTAVAPNAGALNSGDAGTDTVIASLRTQVNALIADLTAERALVNELRAALVEKGVIKGAA